MFLDLGHVFHTVRPLTQDEMWYAEEVSLSCAATTTSTSTSSDTITGTSTITGTITGTSTPVTGTITGTSTVTATITVPKDAAGIAVYAKGAKTLFLYSLGMAIYQLAVLGLVAEAFGRHWDAERLEWAVMSTGKVLNCEKMRGNPPDMAGHGFSAWCVPFMTHGWYWAMWLPRKWEVWKAANYHSTIHSTLQPIDSQKNWKRRFPNEFQDWSGASLLDDFGQTILASIQPCYMGNELQHAPNKSAAGRLPTSYPPICPAFCWKPVDLSCQHGQTRLPKEEM